MKFRQTLRLVSPAQFGRSCLSPSRLSALPILTRSHHTVSCSESLASSSSSFYSRWSRYVAPTLACSAAAFAAFVSQPSHADAAAVATTTTAPVTTSATTGVKKPTVPEPEPTQLVNWSGTHTVSTPIYYQPETIDELKAIVAHAHENHVNLRPVGSALSPNGLPLSEGGMINMCDMDEIVSIDKETGRVTVQAGARVSQVVEALRPHGLTLRNYASIAEQQIAGFTQVSAHGTGAAIPPVDEQVVAVRLVTPAAGELTLSIDDEDPSLFRVARTALGLLGVVAEVTLQCVPAHKLIEHTVVMTHDEVTERHAQLMHENRHLRYMWIPMTDAVIVVTCNPIADDEKQRQEQLKAVTEAKPAFSEEEKLHPVRDLLLTHPGCKLSKEDVYGMRFTAVRDELLALNPLDVQWIKKVNEVEAEFWRRSQGVRIDWSDQILQFDCGGQQWVSEVSFPVRNLDGPTTSTSNTTTTGTTPTDLQFIFNVLDIIEREKIAAHSPIEQRWTAASSSPMSPAAEKPDAEPAKLYSWVGIIMYMPDAEVDNEARENITKAFKHYKHLCEYKLWADIGAVEHWAKIEMPDNAAERTLLQVRTRRKYPVDGFVAICDLFDPHGILRNDLTNTIFGMKSEAKE